MPEEKFTDFLTEEKVLQIFSIDKNALDLLRQRNGLPYIKITKTSRMYCKPDLVKWMKERKVSL